MLREVLSTLRQRPSLAAALAAIAARDPVRLEGLAGSHLAAVLCLLQARAGRPLALVVPADIELEAMLLDLRAFHGRHADSVVAFPPLEVNPYGSVPPHDDIVRERLQTLDRCLRHRVDIVLAPIRCWIERVQAPEQFHARSMRLHNGAQRAPETVVEALVQAGYRRVSLVEELGEFAVRGGILDVFPPTREHPVRLEFFGDEIESMREFNPRDQRSMRTIEEIELPPATAAAADDPEAPGGESTWLQASLAD